MRLNAGYRALLLTSFCAFTSLPACDRVNASSAQSASAAASWSPEDAYRAYLALPGATKAAAFSQLSQWSPQKLAQFIAKTNPSVAQAALDSAAEMSKAYPTLGQMWSAAHMDMTKLSLSDFQGEGTSGLGLLDTQMLSLGTSKKCQDYFNRFANRYGVAAATVVSQVNAAGGIPGGDSAPTFTIDANTTLTSASGLFLISQANYPADYQTGPNTACFFGNGTLAKVEQNHPANNPDPTDPLATFTPDTNE